MRVTVIALILLSPFLSHAYYQQPWEKLCETRLTNKQNLYEVYHDCMDLCMLTSSEHKDLKLKERHRICTFFTAHLHNRQSKGIEIKLALSKGLLFCTDQKIHRNGGHWLWVSRQCKRIICEDKSEATQKENETCRTMNNHLNNGRLQEVYQKPTPSDKDRRGTVPNTLLKKGEQTAPLEEQSQPVETKVAP